MKKILLFAIGILTSVTMLAEVKPYTDSETGFMYEYDTEKKTATFAGVLEANKNVKYAVVKSSIKGSDGLDYPVTAIGTEAFKGCSSLRLLTLPETLTSIASNAFSGCDDLKHIYCKVLNPKNILNPGGLPSYSDAKMVTLYVETNESKSNYENDPNWNIKYSRILVGPMSSEPFKYKDGNDDLTGMFYVCAEGSKEATLFTGKNEKDIVVPKTIIYNGDNYNVTGIDRLAFNQFSEIEKLWLPETLTDISNYAFNGCSNLIYIGLEQTQSPRYKPSVFPSNELMTLFIPENAVDGYLNSQWDKNQFDDRIYKGKMKEFTDRNGMKYICADRKNDGDAILVTGKDGISNLSSSIDIDEKYYSLKGIGKSAFENCTLITSLNISSGVTTISNSAFKGCSNLQSLTLPSTLKTIGSYAFSGCSNLSKLPSLSGLLSLGSYAFSGCSKLQDLKLPSSLTTIGNNAFNGCSNIRTLDIPYNLKSIGSGAFNGCSSLAHIRCRVTDPSKLDPANLPSNEMMTLYVEENCSGNYINSTDFKTTWKAKFNGRIYEGDWVFVDDKDGMYYICSPVSKKATLYKGKSDTDITISDIEDGNNTYSVTGIDRQAFKGSSLEKLTLPNTITHIGPEAFSGCSSLDRVVSYIETPFKINENVFSTAKKLYVPEDTRDNYIKFAGWNKFSYKMEGEPISVPNEAGTFICASKSKEAILTVGNKQTTSVTINPSIQDEESNTYQVIAIEKGAFQNSGELVKLTFMDNTGSENSISIGDNAFSSCSKLRVLTLPSKVELGSRVFNGSNNLEYIICKSTSPKIIDNEVFTTTIGTLYVPTSYSGAYNIEGWNKFTKRVECEDMQVHSLDDGMTYEYLSKIVESGTLRTATVIKDSKGSTTVSPKDGVLEIKSYVSLPSGGDPYTIVSIAKEAFKGNGNIKELKLSDDITSIGGNAFQNCSNLQNLKLSSTLTTIEDNAFQNCSKLKSFTIPQTLTTIGDNAFEGCLALTELVSDGIEQIGTSAFKDCTGLINVTIPESLSTIGDYAFNGCTNLTEIINKREEPAAINANVFSNNKTILYVSSESVEDYKNAVGWKDLTILQGLKDEFSDEFNTYSFATGEEFATLTKSLIKESNYTIPDIVKNPKTGIEYKVTAIDRTAFENNATLENLYIPEGVKTIGAKAFYNCTKLKKVELPSSLDFIGDQAFDKCTAINKISSRILSTKLENLCSKITNVFASGISPKVYIPIEDESKYETYWSIFKDKFIEGRLDMGNDVAYGWEYEYFTGKTEEERIATLTQALAESTETSATGYLPILGKVKFASDEEALEYTVTEIAENAFNEYPTPSRVEKLSIEENITSIGDNAFKVLSSLKMVWLPSTLETIGTNAFNTTSITHVCSEATKLPESKSEIVNDSKSPYLFVPQEKTATYLNKNGWKNFAETNIYEGYFVDEKTPETDKYRNLTFLYIKDKKGGETKTAILTKSKTNTNDVEIPSSVSIDTDSYDVTEIAGSAFSTSSNLMNITIPKYVVKIGDNAFSTCGNLKNITCLNPVPVSINSNVFPSYTAALYVPDGVAGSYVLADVWKDFTTIHNGARMVAENKAMGLTYEYASNEVVATLIEGKDKSSVKIDNVAPETSDVKVTSIAESAFENNTSIQSVVIPEGIETIGPKAFQNCSNLTTIEFPSTLTSIGEKAFNGCVKVGTIISYIPYTKLDGLCDFSEVFYTETPISPNIYIPVGDESFSAYTSKWNISEGTKFFQGYSKTTVDGNGWEYAYRKGVDDYAVLTKATSSITDNGHLVIPGTLKIGTDDNASEIKVTEIAATAFNAYPDKAKVVKLTISENIKTIRENAFSAFSNVQKLWLPSTLETVEANAFSTNKLNYVCSEATKSPSLASSVFAENKEAYLLVPNVEVYQANINWIGDKIKIYEGYFVDDITPTTDDYSNQTFICLLNKKDGDDKRAILIKSTTNIEDVEIPETVLLGGESYDVKEIAELAFSGSSNLKNITIPSTVNKIGDKAFASCNQILNINCNMIAPIDINANVFPGFTAALYVPASDDPNSEEAPVNKYGKADVWKDFKAIHNGNRMTPTVDGLTYEYASGEQYATLIKGETAGDVTIENKVPDTNKYVTSIGESAFIGNTQITSLTIDEGITKIGASAFENCSKISKITLPEGLTDIGAKAFAGCTKIDEIITDVKETELKPISMDVFSSELKNRTTVYIPAGDVTEAAYRDEKKSGGWSIFDIYKQGKWEEEFVASENIRYRYRSGSTEATVIEITHPANQNVLEIKGEVELGGEKRTVVTIAPTAISHKDVIETILIDEGIKEIGVDAFSGCANLKSVKLPSSLNTIGANAFKGCSKLTKLWLPSHVVKIDNNAFNGCGLTHVSCEMDILPTIDKNVFSNYNAYLFVPKETDYNLEGWSKFARVYEGKYIGESTYNNNDYIYLKQKDDSRTAVLVSSSGGLIPNDPISFEDPQTSEKDNYTVTIIGKEAFSGKNLDLSSLERLPEGIEMIEESAFKNCKLSKLKSLPSNLKKIGKYAFSGNNLVTLELPSSLTTIEDGAFKDNRMLVSITMKENLETIGADAFNGCTSLEKLELPKSLMSIGDYAFSKNSKLESLTIPDGLNKIGAYAFNECTSLKELKLPESLRTIGNSAFYANTNLKALTMSEGIETIGDYTFKGCSNLNMVELPSSVTAIGTGVFDDCNGMTEIVSRINDPYVIGFAKPDAILYVPIDAYTYYVNASLEFADIYMVEREEKVVDGIRYAYSTGSKKAILIKAETINEDGSVDIPSSITFEENGDAYEVTTIDKSAFSGNTDIKKVIIQGSVRTIGANAFLGCTNLTMVELPSTLTTIGTGAFDGCSSLTDVISNITDNDAISKIALSLPNATLYVPNDETKNNCKDAGWEFANYYVGSRIEVPVDGLNYVCATGDKTAIVIEAKEGCIDENGIVTIPSTIPVTLVEGEAAENYKVIAIEDNVFSGNTDIKAVKIGDNVKTIGVNAFQGCTNLTKVWFPASLEEIGAKAFDECRSIAFISTKRITPIDIKDVFSVYNKATLYVPDEAAIESYMVDNLWKQFPIKRVGDFVDLTTQNDITYECVIKGEGEAATYEAMVVSVENKEVVAVPNKVNLEDDEPDYVVTSISKQAFGDCTKLTKLWLPASLNEIGEKAFYDSKSITYICTSSKTPVAKIGESAFNLNADKVTLYVPDEEAVSNYENNEYWNKFSNKKVGYLVDVTTQDKITYECVMNGGVATALLVKSESTATDVEIPLSVKLDDDTEYKVTTISKQTFKGNGNIVTLKIGENVKSIDDEAFLNCSKLQKVWLPSSLESIGNKAFNGCKSITRVSTKTKTMPSLGSEVFSTSSAYLFVPEGTESSWTGFAKVVEGHYVGDVTSDNISYICMETGDATEKTSMLIKAPKTASTFASSVVFEKNSYPLTTIGESAFEDNTAIVNLVIPDGVKAIEANAFKNASKLRTVEFPASIESIGDNAFEGCSLAYIQSYIQTPSAISENVFADAVYSNATLFVSDNTSNNYNVDGWKNFTIVEGVYSEVTIEDMSYLCVMSQDKLVAKQTKSLSKTKEVKVPAKIFVDGINYQVEGIEKSAFEGNSSLEKVIVSEGIKTIGQSAFKQCSNLKSLVLPASLENVGDYAFDNCLRLATVTCAGEKPVDISDNVFSATGLEVNVSSRSAVKAYKDHKVWGSFDIYYSMSSSSESGTEETNVATYQIVSSEENDETTVAIVDDDNVTGDFSIQATVERNGIVIPVTMIAPSAFEDNTELTSISLPATITSIGEGAFAGCEKLQSITVNNPEPVALSSTPAAVRGIRTRAGERSVFEGVNMETCILYVPEGSVDKYKAADVWKDFKNIQAISATGVAGVIMDGTPFDVYNLQGRKVKSGVTTLKGLTPGVYIVKGKKVVLK